MKTIIIDSPTHGRFEVLLDDDDFDMVNRFKWSITKDHNTFYARHTFRKDGIPKCVPMHRYILGLTDPKILVDHVNHVGTDNRRCNIRIVTNRQNQHNLSSYKGSSSKYKGVSWCKPREKWRVFIKVNENLKYLGAFDDEKEAAHVYNNAVREFFGEYGYINII